MSVTSLRTTTATTRSFRWPVLAPTRRALLRLQAARVSRQVIDELVDRREPRHGHQPHVARLDELADRYATLGGEPSDLLGRRRTSGGGAFDGLRRTLRARHDAWLRRELDAAQTARAHRHEIGGDFSVLP
jgi:hypothetical protein